jgi:hypothetical protein
MYSVHPSEQERYYLRMLCHVPGATCYDDLLADLAGGAVLVEGGWVHGVEGAPDGMYTKNVVYKEVFVAAGH